MFVHSFIGRNYYGKVGPEQFGSGQVFYCCDCIASCCSPGSICVKLGGINFWSDPTLLLIAFSAKKCP